MRDRFLEASLKPMSRHPTILADHTYDSDRTLLAGLHDAEEGLRRAAKHTLSALRRGSREAVGAALGDLGAAAKALHKRVGYIVLVSTSVRRRDLLVSRVRSLEHATSTFEECAWAALDGGHAPDSGQSPAAAQPSSTSVASAGSSASLGRSETVVRDAAGSRLEVARVHLFSVLSSVVQSGGQCLLGLREALRVIAVRTKLFQITHDLDQGLAFLKLESAEADDVEREHAAVLASVDDLTAVFQLLLGYTSGPDDRSLLDSCLLDLRQRIDLLASAAANFCNRSSPNGHRERVALVTSADGVLAARHHLEAVGLAEAKKEAIRVSERGALSALDSVEVCARARARVCVCVCVFALVRSSKQRFAGFFF